ARSAEVNSAAVLLTVSVVLALFGPRLLSSYASIMRDGLVHAGDPKLVRGDGLGALVSWGLRSAAFAVAPIALAALAAGVIANVAQVRLKFTPLALKPSLAKINPLHGLKRLFGRDGVIETVKAALKTGTIGLVAFFVIEPRIKGLSGLAGTPPREALGQVGSAVRALTIWV